MVQRRGDLISAGQGCLTNSFTYDGLDRLTTATGTLFASESYSFDTLGRMTSRTVGGIARPYGYSDLAPQDAPSSYNGTSYTYDANGSQVSTSAGQSRTFDPEGRLSSISAGTTVSAYQRAATAHQRRRRRHHSPCLPLMRLPAHPAA